MAELPPELVRLLCSAFDRVLGEELGVAVRCEDVTPRNLRWDIEAWDLEHTLLLRRIDHTRAVAERIMKAFAELIHDMSPAINRELAARGVRGYRISYGANDLPKNKRERLKLAPLIVRKIVSSIALAQKGGMPLNVGDSINVLTALDPLRNLDDRLLWRRFTHITAWKAPSDLPAEIGGSSDVRLARWMPPLSTVVLPMMLEKLDRHGPGASDMTLIVELVDDDLNTESAEEVRVAVQTKHRGFRSVYLAKLTSPKQEVKLERVY